MSQYKAHYETKSKSPIRKMLVRKMISYYDILEKYRKEKPKSSYVKNPKEALYMSSPNNLNSPLRKREARINKERNLRYYRDDIMHKKKLLELKELMRVELERIRDEDENYDMYDEESIRKSCSGFPSFMKEKRGALKDKTMLRKDTDNALQEFNRDTRLKTIGKTLEEKVLHAITHPVSSESDVLSSSVDFEEKERLYHLDVKHNYRHATENEKKSHDFLDRKSKEIRRIQYAVAVRGMSNKKSRSPVKRGVLSPVKKKNRGSSKKKTKKKKSKSPSKRRRSSRKRRDFDDLDEEEKSQFMQIARELARENLPRKEKIRLIRDLENLLEDELKKMKILNQPLKRSDPEEKHPIWVMYRNRAFPGQMKCINGFKINTKDEGLLEVREGDVVTIEINHTELTNHRNSPYAFGNLPFIFFGEIRRPKSRENECDFIVDDNEGHRYKILIYLRESEVEDSIEEAIKSVNLEPIEADTPPRYKLQSDFEDPEDDNAGQCDPLYYSNKSKKNKEEEEKLTESVVKSHKLEETNCEVFDKNGAFLGRGMAKMHDSNDPRFFTKAVLLDSDNITHHILMKRQGVNEVVIKRKNGKKDIEYVEREETKYLPGLSAKARILTIKTFFSEKKPQIIFYIENISFIANSPFLYNEEVIISCENKEDYEGLIHPNSTDENLVVQTGPEEEEDIILVVLDNANKFTLDENEINAVINSNDVMAKNTVIQNDPMMNRILIKLDDLVVEKIEERNNIKQAVPIPEATQEDESEEIYEYKSGNIDEKETSEAEQDANQPESDGEEEVIKENEENEENEEEGEEEDDQEMKALEELVKMKEEEFEKQKELERVKEIERKKMEKEKEKLREEREKLKSKEDDLIKKEKEKEEELEKEKEKLRDQEKKIEDERKKLQDMIDELKKLKESGNKEKENEEIPEEDEENEEETAEVEEQEKDDQHDDKKFSNHDSEDDDDDDKFEELKKQMEEENLKKIDDIKKKLLEEIDRRKKEEEKRKEAEKEKDDMEKEFERKLEEHKKKKEQEKKEEEERRKREKEEEVKRRDKEEKDRREKEEEDRKKREEEEKNRREKEEEDRRKRDEEEEKRRLKELEEAEKNKPVMIAKSIQMTSEEELEEEVNEPPLMVTRSIQLSVDEKIEEPEKPEMVTRSAQMSERSVKSEPEIEEPEKPEMVTKSIQLSQNEEDNQEDEEDQEEEEAKPLMVTKSVQLTERTDKDEDEEPEEEEKSLSQEVEKKPKMVSKSIQLTKKSSPEPSDNQSKKAQPSEKSRTSKKSRRSLAERRKQKKIVKKAKSRKSNPEDEKEKELSTFEKLKKEIKELEDKVEDDKRKDLLKDWKSMVEVSSPLRKEKKTANKSTQGKSSLEPNHKDLEDAMINTVEAVIIEEMEEEHDSNFDKSKNNSIKAVNDPKSERRSRRSSINKVPLSIADSDVSNVNLKNNKAQSVHPIKNDKNQKRKKKKFNDAESSISRLRHESRNEVKNFVENNVKPVRKNSKSNSGPKHEINKFITPKKDIPHESVESEIYENYSDNEKGLTQTNHFGRINLNMGIGDEQDIEFQGYGQVKITSRSGSPSKQVSAAKFKNPKASTNNKRLSRTGFTKRVYDTPTPGNYKRENVSTSSARRRNRKLELLEELRRLEEEAARTIQLQYRYRKRKEDKKKRGVDFSDKETYKRFLQFYKSLPEGVNYNKATALFKSMMDQIEKGD